MAFQRTGSCEKCGQCCGAEGSPNQESPWPKNMFFHYRDWQYEHWKKRFSYIDMLGIMADPDGKSVREKDVGSVRFTGGGPARRYYYTWVDDRPLKDTSVAHDGSSHSLECPFLADDPGDGSRPCGLVGEIDRDLIEATCWFKEPVIFSQRQKNQWEEDHPLCSYTWVEVD